MHYEIAYHTDVGIQKKINQDSLCAVIADSSYGESCLAVLCDGMGGMQLGEVASGIAVYRFRNWFREVFPLLLEQYGFDRSKIIGSLGAEIEEVDQDLREYSRKQQVKMGTTLTLVLLTEREYITAQLGDSRAYLLSDEIQMLTEDQSYVFREYLEGRITLEQARRHPKRNLLLQCIGGSKEAHPVFTTGTVKWDDRILLCSDGFVHENTELEMFRQLSEYGAKDKVSLHTNLVSLVEKAKAKGERDNISAMTVSILRK